MGLKSMYEASRQPIEQENNLQLIEEQIRKISEQNQTISELSFQVSMLKSEVQKLADKNEKLNEADNVLKLNEELKKQNELLKQARQIAEEEAEDIVTSVEKDYARKEQLLADERAEAQRRTTEAEKLQQSIESNTQKQAKEMVKAKMKSLETTYQAKTTGYYGYMTGVSLYAILVTLFTAIHSEAFMSDFKSFFGTIWGFIVSCTDLLVKGANFVSQIGDKIPQPIVATIVHWLLWLVVVGGAGIGASAFLYIGLAKIVRFYAEKYADNLSLGVALVSLSSFIFFADEIRKVVPINLLFLLMITQMLYVGVRWYIKGYRENRG